MSYYFSKINKLFSSPQAPATDGGGLQQNSASDNGERENKEFFHCGGIDELPKDSSSYAAVFSPSNFLWENGQIILYHFRDGSIAQRKKVRGTIVKWMSYANVKFVEVQDAAEAAHIRITFAGNENKSLIGRQLLRSLGDPLTMWLGDVKVSGDEPTEMEQGVILHEWGHALGLHHEHQSPARGIIINKEETIAYYQNHYQDSSEMIVKWVTHNVFNIQPTSNYSSFDPESIMIYYIPPKCYHLPPGMADPMSSNYITSLSIMDKAYMAINYPFPNGEGGLSFEDALQIMKVPRQDYKGWTYENVREKFQEYNRGMRSPVLVIRVDPEQMVNNVGFYKIRTQTNFGKFKPDTCVQRRFSEFQELHGLLKKKAKYWSPPSLPPTRKIPAGTSRWESLNNFLTEAGKNASKEPPDFLEELRKFLQGGTPYIGKTK